MVHGRGRAPVRSLSIFAKFQLEFRKTSEAPDRVRIARATGINTDANAIPLLRASALRGGLKIRDIEKFEIKRKKEVNMASGQTGTIARAKTNILSYRIRLKFTPIQKKRNADIFRRHLQLRTLINGRRWKNFSRYRELNLNKFDSSKFQR